MCFFKVMNSLAYMPYTHPKAPVQDAHLINGLNEAVQALCEPTPQQRAVIDADRPLVNNGTIVCLTHIRR